MAYTASFNDGTLSSVVVLEAAWRALANGLMHGLWLMRLPSVMEHHHHQLRWKRRDELLLMDWCMLIGERQWGSDNFLLLLLCFSFSFYWVTHGSPNIQRCQCHFFFLLNLIFIFCGDFGSGFFFNLYFSFNFIFNY